MMNYLSKRTSKSGFTIIETLVAITILMVSVAGPLSIATKALSNARYAKDQMIASFLAQESMEYIKNLRDNNLAAAAAGSAVSWLYYDASTNLADATKVQPRDVGAIDPISSLPCDVMYGCELFVGDTGYSRGTSGDTTPFGRYFYLSAPGSSAQCDRLSHECEVHVVVLWQEGTIPYQVELVSALTDVAR